MIPTDSCGTKLLYEKSEICKLMLQDSVPSTSARPCGRVRAVVSPAFKQRMQHLQHTLRCSISIIVFYLLLEWHVSLVSDF
ncbi:hypothetical protein RND71_035360 [Anisodus tanguticus]|uniref:Uncharacterized protein n=1 Tax=Anisodus tanguticus TaxID=243964 RepID=A0AAE1R5N8_9SOLA|nr:hypothetical protein RND71_035360 [Anisodus tanguticus]